MFPSLNLAGGYINIHFFWVFSVLGIIAAVYILLKQIPKYRLNIEILTNKIFLIVAASIIGARISRAIYTWKDFADKGKLLSDLLKYPFDKEYSVWGAAIGALIVFIIYAYKKNQDIWKWMDLFTIPFLVGLSIGHIGLFLDGSRHFGTVTDLPWGIIIDTSKYATEIHPTQIYTSIYCLLIAVVIYKLSKKKSHIFWKMEGNIALTAITSFSFLRFLEEFIIGSDKYLKLFGIYITYYITLALFAGGLTLLIMRYKHLKTTK